MNIPNEATDAAYNAWWNKNDRVGIDPRIASAVRDEIRGYVEAAAPFIAAQAWEDGRDAGWEDMIIWERSPGTGHRAAPNPYGDPQ